VLQVAVDGDGWGGHGARWALVPYPDRVLTACSKPCL
jgi:hypothetical protein